MGELGESVVLQGVSFTELYCWREGASAAPVEDETFDDVGEGDAVIQFKQEPSADGFVHHGRVVVRGAKNSRFRVEATARYLWQGTPPSVSEEALEEYLWREGASVLVPYLREGLSSCASRVGLQVQLPLVAIPAVGVPAYGQSGELET